MSKFLQEFTEFLSGLGMAPSDPSEIMADGKIRSFTIAGDKPRSRKGRYCLWDEGDFASAWALNFREGKTHKWNSRATKKFTDAERREYAKKMEASRKLRETERREAAEKAAEKAARIWKAAKKGKHAYLTKKGISGVGSRVIKGALVVPAFNKDKKIVNVQFISGSGKKLFMKDGEMSGAYGSIGATTDVIYISEGYATAHTIYDVTEKASIWAFNNGNLVPVAEMTRARYPNAEIVIVADNDQWTKKPDGTPWNPGVEKATEAALAVGAYLVVPDFDENDPRKSTDVNDYYCANGKDALRTLLRGGVLQCVVAEEFHSTAPTSHVPGVIEAPGAPERKDWRTQLICDSKGVTIKSSLKNVILILTHHSSYAGVFRYDEFSHQVKVTRCPEWCDEREFSVHTLDDIDISETAAALEVLNISPDRVRIHHAIEVAASKDKFHPARMYFENLKWDGVKRLENWLIYYLGAEGDEPDYLAFIGKKWMVAAVKRVFAPGCKFDHVLVLEGDQGKGKSAALKLLVTFGDAQKESYFTDSVTIADMGNKDTVQKIQGSIIVELAEMSGFDKRSDEEIKRWITLQHDDVRLPYTRTVTKFKRQFVLAGTTNENAYLKDPTGNRRYWPMTCSAIDYESIERDRDQLWAEAYKYYMEGMYIGPTEEEKEMARKAQDKRRASDVWETEAMKAYDELVFERNPTIKTEDVLRKMGISIRDMDHRAQRRVIGILQQNGLVSSVMRVNGKAQRGWVRADA